MRETSHDVQYKQNCRIQVRFSLEKRSLTNLGRIIRLRTFMSVTYLGVILGQILTCSEHLENVIHIAKQAVLTQNRFIGTILGLNPYGFMKQSSGVKSHTVPIVVGPNSAKWHQTTTQHAYRGPHACGAFRSSRVAALDIILVLLPLIYLMLQGKKSSQRIISNNEQKEDLSGVDKYCTEGLRCWK